MRTLALILLLATAACGEAPFKAPRMDDPKLDGAPGRNVTFPSGEWTDDYGNVLAVTVSGNAVTGKGLCGPGLGLTLAGKIKGSTLDYRFTDNTGAEIGTGHADLVNARHAYFEATRKDGGEPGEGLLHFLHDAPARIASGAPPPACADDLNPPPRPDEPQ